MRQSDVDLLQWFKTSYVSSVKSEITSNQKLAEELLKPIIRIFEKQKLYSPFKDNIWGASLTDMQFNK